MSKTSEDDSVVEEEKTLSLSDLLEGPKNRKASCSLLKEELVLPCLGDSRTGRRRRTDPRTRDPGKISQSSSCTADWLRPGLSLPKMREAGPVPCLSRGSSSSSSKKDSQKHSIESRDSPPFASTTSLGGCFLRNRVKAEELAVNFVGPSECQSSFEVASSDLHYNPIELDDTQPEESKELKNWEKWMEMRRRQNERFSKKLNRDKSKLVMNTAEDIRQIKEEKEMMMYAQIPPPDKWRGSIYFWKERPKLSVKGTGDYYYAHQTPYDRGIVPPMEFIDVPTVVRREKDVIGDGQSAAMKIWTDSDYRKSQRKEYEKKLRRIKNKKVDLKDLIVVGERILPEPEDESTVVYDIPAIEVTPPPDEVALDYEEVEYEGEGEVFVPCPRAGPFGRCEIRESVAALSINGTVVTYPEDVSRDLASFDDRYAWSLIFEPQPVGSVTERTLHVENRGTMSVRYEWVPVGSPPRVATFPARKSEGSVRCFYFDKNSGIFVPGQKYQLKFYHYAKYPGYHTETWRMKLIPNLFGDSEYGSIRLTAVAEEADDTSQFHKVEAYLEACIRDSIVRKVAEEVFERSRPPVPRPIEYQSLFTEEELFEFQNTSHFYRHDVVEELKNLFYEIPVDPPTEWDLNLFTLEDFIRSEVTGKTQHLMLCKLMDLSRSLLRPGRETYKTDRKRKMLYNALCRAADVIDNNANRIKANLLKPDDPDDSEWEELRNANDSDRYLILSDSYKSGASQVSVSDPSKTSEATLTPEEDGNRQVFLSELESAELAVYRHALYTMVYNQLGEAAEHAAGIIESCRLFEHRGEVTREEVLYEESFASV